MLCHQCTFLFTLWFYSFGLVLYVPTMISLKYLFNFKNVSLFSPGYFAIRLTPRSRQRPGLGVASSKSRIQIHVQRVIGLGNSFHATTQC